MAALFQVGLIAGQSEDWDASDVTFKMLAQHGDTGLGRLCGRNGIMILLDGDFYRIDTEGAAALMDPGEITPFSVVTKFSPAYSFRLDNIDSLSKLNKALDANLATFNLFYMLRIDVELDWIQLGYAPCGEVGLASQAVPLSLIKGSLIVSRCPACSSGISLLGYHHHFIGHDRKLGGHVLDLALKTAKVWVTPLRRFSLVLLNSKTVWDMHSGSGVSETLSRMDK